MRAAGLLRPTLTLLAGAALAQVLPLLLGPWLTRLYTPAQFGQYHLFAAVAANLAVVACARYEFALPIAADDREAALLRALGLRVLAAAVVISLAAALAWWAAAGARWALWLPAAVGVLGGLSLASLLATRAQRFRALALARVLQHGGGALLQALAGVWQAGVHGLIAAPIAAAGAALVALGLPRPDAGAAGTAGAAGVADAAGAAGAAGGAGAAGAVGAAGAAGAKIGPGELRAVARRHREFPLLNTPHAFMGALQDTLTMALIAATIGAGGAGMWGVAMRYLKAPAALIGGALSQALYPQLAAQGPGVTAAARALVRRAMATLALLAAPLVLALWLWAPAAFAWVFGEPWREAGDLAQALALYIGLHFVASPLAVVTMAWQAQAWALKLALAGQAAFIGALLLGLAAGRLATAGWAVSIATTAYFGLYFWKLARWPLAAPADTGGR